ncbi:MAG: Maf family protein [Ruthenibacterium sp.]
MKEIILASASPRRKELMRLITPHYTVVVSDVEERALTADTPAQLAAVLGSAKCRAVAQNHPDAVVIGCDTVVECGGKMFGKPRDKAQAFAMLQALSGLKHLVHTGVCVRCGAREECFTVTTGVTFAPLSKAEIAAYVSTDEPYDKAGGYGVQGRAACFITGLAGCYYNVMGFPVQRVYRTLRDFGCLPD